MRFAESSEQVVNHRRRRFLFDRVTRDHGPRAAGARLLVTAAALSLLVAGCSGTDTADFQASTPSPATPSAESTATSGPAPSGSTSPAASGKTTPTPSVSLNLKPKAGTVNSLTAVKGYTYADPAAALLRAVAQAQAQYDQVSTGRVVRSVRASDKSVAEIAIFSLDKKFAGSDTLRAQLLQALVLDLAGGGASPASQSLGGAPTVAGVSKGSLAVGWYTDTDVIVVVMPEGSTKPGLTFATAYRRATGGTE